ncbi:MAG: winged helix-turn-helix transcriptional regulator, partial [Nitrosospira sp.]|nr:winged helix-turn-helix transcriptional regulator [Nitrosospira sp.]
MSWPFRNIPSHPNPKGVPSRSMPEHTLTDETRFRLLRRLADDPALSQRELAGELGVSLGKVN